MRIFVPIICYNHTANTEFMMSLMRLMLLCQEKGIGLSFYPIFFDSLVNRARNAAVAHFMSDDKNTHLVFLDADIEFQPDDVLKMITADKDIVAVGYAQKWIDLKLLHVALNNVDSKQVLPLTTNASVHLVEKQEVGPIMEARYATTGFMCIKRGVIEKMMEAFPERKYKNDVDGYMSSNQDMFYDLFTVSVNPDTKRFESEDYGFCRLWRSIGGKIYVLTDITLNHYGWFGYPNNINAQLKFFKELQDKNSLANVD